MAKIDNIENDIIIKEIGNNKNGADVCKNLNISDNQYNRKRLKDFVKEKNIDISHFVSKFNKTDYELNPKLCENCGGGEIHPITGNVPLQIHHIDGDATNNNEENLQLLCPNCHCLTENYGALNKHATKVDNRKRG